MLLLNGCKKISAFHIKPEIIEKSEKNLKIKIEEKPLLTSYLSFSQKIQLHMHLYL